MFDYLINLPPWGHRVLALLLMLGGAGLGVSGTMKLLDACMSQNWPVVTGTVLESKVAQHSVRRGRFGRKIVFRPEVTYAYRVSGQVYAGERLSFHETDYSNSADAHADANRYRAEDQISIRYKPSDPSCSVIMPGATQAGLIMPGIGIVFFVVGVVLEIASGRSGRRKPQPEEGWYEQEAATLQTEPRYSSQ